jgi:hypothetical protein
VSPVPSTTTCPAVPADPWRLQLGPTPLFEGTPVANLAALLSAMEHSAANRALQRHPIPRILLVAAPPDFRASDVLAWLPRDLPAYAYTERPHDFATRTRGLIHHSEPCAIPLPSIPATGSWRDFLTAR